MNKVRREVEVSKHQQDLTTIPAQAMQERKQQEDWTKISPSIGL
jgi:hypothetical protein